MPGPERFLDMGRVVGFDSSGKTDVVYAHFEGTDYSGWEPFPVPIVGTELDAAGISRTIGTEFWAEINDGATQPDEVMPVVVNDTEYGGGTLEDVPTN